MMSDGECQEGTTWESLLISTKQNLNNLKIIIDYNKIQALSKLDDALPLNNLINKFKAFNCNTVEIKNGHSFPSIIKALKKKFKNKKPTVFVFHTIKGKGIKKFENDPIWHARKLVGKEIDIGKKSLGIK